MVVVSVASMWEITIKSRLGKLTLPVPLALLVERHRQESGVRFLPIVEAHVHAHETLAGVHRDPFDRMLVAQAAAEGMVIVTRDPLIQQYDVPTLW